MEFPASSSTSHYVDGVSNTENLVNKEEFFDCSSTTTPEEEGTSAECMEVDKDMENDPLATPPEAEPGCSNLVQEENTRGRRSRRRVETAKFPVLTTVSPSAEWTTKEKEALLIALKKYGTLDIEELSKAVPTKTPDRIKLFINAVWKNSRLSLMKSVEKKYIERKGKKPAASDKTYLAPLDQWLEKMKEYMPNNFNESRAVSLAKAVQFIAKYEDQPDPSKCGGVDFRAVYEFLFCMLSGFPPKTLDPITSQFLLVIMRNFARAMKKMKFETESCFLQRLLTPSFVASDPDFACQECTDDTTIDTSMLELLKVPGFNPFSIPMHLLEKHC